MRMIIACVIGVAAVLWLVGMDESPRTRMASGAIRVRSIQASAEISGQDIRNEIVAYALSRRGDPYVSGGRIEGGSDCSGFTQLVYLTVVGVDIGATTFDQWPGLKHIDQDQVMPGDLWYGRWNTSGSWDSEHTGIVADLDTDGRLDLIHNGADLDEVHVTDNFLETYLGDHTLGFARVLATVTAPLQTGTGGDHDDWSIKRAPSISAARIDQILADSGSPAAGTGQIFYDLGVQYGIDPAYALAFFYHESGLGTACPQWAGCKPGGETTHNIGNIICTGTTSCYGRFRDYPSWAEGIEDWYALIDREYVGDRGMVTIDEVIPVYAPSFENDVGGYQNVVASTVASWRGEP